MNLFSHKLHTAGAQSMTRITASILSDLRESGVQEGIAVVWSPHTTAGITVNENADPDVVRDMLYGFEKAIPSEDPHYLHAEGNSHAHMKTTLFGPSQTLIVANGRLLLGVWQDVYFCDFDGPRDRTYYVKIIDG